MHSKNLLFIPVFVVLFSCQPSSSTLNKWKASLCSELDKQQVAFETYATICGLLDKPLFHLNAQNDYTATPKAEIEQQIKLIEQMGSSGELSEEDAEDFGMLHIIDIPQKKRPSMSNWINTENNLETLTNDFTPT